MDDEESNEQIDEQMMCTSCGYKGKSKGGICPKCGNKMKMVGESSEQLTQDHNKGGLNKVTEQQTTEIAETKVEVNAEIAKAEEKVEAKSDETSKLLMEMTDKMKSLQEEIKSLKEKEIKSKIKGVVDEEADESTGLRIVEGRGSLRGGSFTLVIA